MTSVCQSVDIFRISQVISYHSILTVPYYLAQGQHTRYKGAQTTITTIVKTGLRV